MHTAHTSGGSGGKVLDVNEFHSIVDQIVKDLAGTYDSLYEILAAVENIIKEDTALKGKTGEAVRSYYREIHQYVLLYLLNILEDYANMLTNIKGFIQSFESADTGFVNEFFLDTIVESSLTRLNQVVGSIIADANTATRSVSDLIGHQSVSTLDFQSEINRAKNYLKDTIEDLHSVDQQTTGLVQSLKRDLNNIEQFMNDLQNIHLDGTISIPEFKPDTIYSLESFRQMVGELVHEFGGEPEEVIDLGDFTNYKDARLLIYDDGTAVLQYELHGELHYEVIHELPDEIEKELEKIEEEIEKLALSTGADLVPFVGNIKSGYEAIVGTDPITGEKLSVGSRIVSAAGIIFGPIVKGGKNTVKLAGNAGDITKTVKKYNQLKHATDALTKTKKITADDIRKLDHNLLDDMESIGGHTLRRHVSQTNNELINRAIKDGVDVTTFNNKNTAIKAVQENIRNNADDIVYWFNNTDDYKKAFNYKHNYPIGKGVNEKRKQVIYDLTNSRVVLVRDPNSEHGFKIITSFPTFK